MLEFLATVKNSVSSMSMYGKNHYNIVISLQLIKTNGKKKKTQKKSK